MLLDYLGYVIWGDLSVPNTFRIDEHRDADRAKANRTAVRQNDLALRIAALGFLSLSETLGLQYPFKLSLNLSTADLRTRFSVTDEYVAFDGSAHHRSEFFELVSVLDKFRLCHSKILALQAIFIASPDGLRGPFLFCHETLAGRIEDKRLVVESRFDFPGRSAL